MIMMISITYNAKHRLSLNRKCRRKCEKRISSYYIIDVISNLWNITRNFIPYNLIFFFHFVIFVTTLEYTELHVWAPIRYLIRRISVPLISGRRLFNDDKFDLLISTLIKYSKYRSWHIDVKYYKIFIFYNLYEFILMVYTKSSRQSLCMTVVFTHALYRIDYDLMTHLHWLPREARQFCCEMTKIHENEMTRSSRNLCELQLLEIKLMSFCNLKNKILYIFNKFFFFVYKYRLILVLFLFSPKNLCYGFETLNLNRKI